MRQFATTSRTGARKKVPRFLNFPKPRKLPREKVLELVREIVLKQNEDDIRMDLSNSCFRAESVAKTLNVEVSKVIWSFHKLNLCGILRQRSRVLPDDTNRSDAWHYGNDTGWAANVYYLVMPGKKEPEEADYHESPDGTIAVWEEKDAVKRPRFSKRLGKRLEKR